MSEVHGKELLQGKKSIGEILDLAISFEKTARDFYAGLVPKVSKNLRWLVQELAEEEQRHYDLFSELKERPDIEQYLSAEVATPAADRRFSDAVLLPDLGEHPDDQEILRYALFREHAAMEQYGELAETALPKPTFSRDRSPSGSGPPLSGIHLCLGPEGCPCRKRVVHAGKSVGDELP